MTHLTWDEKVKWELIDKTVPALIHIIEYKFTNKIRKMDDIQRQ